jgi:hypothetical protein
MKQASCFLSFVTRWHTGIEGRSHTGLRILVVLSYFDEDVPLNAKGTAGVEHKKSKTSQE